MIPRERDGDELGLLSFRGLSVRGLRVPDGAWRLGVEMPDGVLEVAGSPLTLRGDEGAMEPALRTQNQAEKSEGEKKRKKDSKGREPFRRA